MTSEDRYYTACMILGAAGDALAFMGGDWEFQRDGTVIHKAIEDMGGLDKLVVKGLKVSDDTIMHLATARGMKEAKSDSVDKICVAVSKEYIDCMNDMSGRAPGITCIRGAKKLKQNPDGVYWIPFDRAGGGCGGAMRSMCVGLRFPQPEKEPKLIAVAIETGRMTHNHPTGYLGSLASALFTAYAIRRIEPKAWGKMLLDTLPKAMEYVKGTGREVAEAEQNWGYFKEQWEKYLQDRGISDGISNPMFPDNYGVASRDEYYKKLSWDGWGGSSGHDAPMIAYDAFLGAQGSWEELMRRGFFHGGDSDSTAIIAAAWYGAYYGYHKVPPAHYEQVEKYTELGKIGADLFKLAFPK